MYLYLLALVLSFILSMGLYPGFINYLKSQSVTQKPSEYALKEYKEKSSTVTFGGLIFVLIPVVISLLLLKGRFNKNVFLLIILYMGFGLLGFIDDYKIIKEGKNDGLSARTKFIAQLILSVLFYLIYMKFGGNNSLSIPFKKEALNLSFFYPILVIFMISGSSNAVNLTDGMDGLASGTVLIALIPFLFFLKLQGMKQELVFILTVMGALLAFLLYNRKPAKIFMGDVGSLALGALISGLAIISGREFVFVIIAGVFIFETLTVIIQQISWRTRKKRVFKYTPIHYSFIISGWKEKQVVLLFYALGIGFAVIGLALGILS